MEMIVLNRILNDAKGAKGAKGAKIQPVRTRYRKPNGGEQKLTAQWPEPGAKRNVDWFRCSMCGPRSVRCHSTRCRALAPRPRTRATTPRSIPCALESELELPTALRQPSTPFPRRHLYESIVPQPSLRKWS
jgi:hypothetical protein